MKFMISVLSDFIAVLTLLTRYLDAHSFSYSSKQKSYCMRKQKIVAIDGANFN